jgi:hypothetical protein
MRKALVLDKRAGSLAVQVCRALARRGYEITIFGIRGSIAFRSKYCTHAIELPAWSPESIGNWLRRMLTGETYDAVYLCNEEILAVIPSLLESGALKSLPMPQAPEIEALLSKNKTLARVKQHGIAAPITFVPANEREVEQAADELKFPLLIKGERGENSRNLRFVTNRKSLLPLYREMVRIEEPYGGRPALQEIVKGQAYSVGGLFQEGRPLRLCAHRKLLTYPRAGGVTVKGITERPRRLLEEAIKTFAAFRYTGLGHAEFIHDKAQDTFKFIEINPRVWGSIGVTEHAGVDLYSPYQQLIDGGQVSSDLRYREGVIYHRFSAEMQLIIERPLRLAGFIKDALDLRVTSDFSWSDLGPYLAAVRRTRSSERSAAYGLQTVEMNRPARE